MNLEVFLGIWLEKRSQVCDWWAKTTAGDCEQAGGKADQLLRLVQKKYDYPRECADQEFNQLIEEIIDPTTAASIISFVSG